MSFFNEQFLIYCTDFEFALKRITQKYSIFCFVFIFFSSDRQSTDVIELMSLYKKFAKVAVNRLDSSPLREWPMSP